VLSTHTILSFWPICSEEVCGAFFVDTNNVCHLVKKADAANTVANADIEYFTKVTDAAAI